MCNYAMSTKAKATNTLLSLILIAAVFHIYKFIWLLILFCLEWSEKLAAKRVTHLDDKRHAIYSK